jgi:hypothetical protein
MIWGTPVFSSNVGLDHGSGPCSTLVGTKAAGNSITSWGIARSRQRISERKGVPVAMAADDSRGKTGANFSIELSWKERRIKFGI